MPAMFSRRSRTPSNTRNNAPPSSSAAIAASSAFLKSSTSTASLSSAAAAAALRSHTTSPEPVGNLQTKRMIRRGSQSSVGSGSIMGGAGRGGAGRGMVRQNSQSSMTERTFRSPSPSTPARNGAVSPAPDAPPVPALPKNMPAKQKRSASLEPPMRVSSPTPRKGARNVSVDRTSFPATVSSQRASTLQQVPEQQREERQESVNFSRPISTPQSTPPVSPIQRPTTSGAWFTSPAVSNAAPRATSDQRPKTSDGLSSHEVSTIQQSIQSAADQPVAKKKKKTAATNEGKHLANGTLAPAPQGTTVSSPVAAQPVQSVEAPATPIQKKKPVTPAIDTNVPDVPPPRNPARLSPGAEEGRSPRASGLLHKQPSVVREDPEAEESAERGVSVTKRTGLTKSNSVSQARDIISTSAGPAVPYTAPGAQHTRSVSLDIPRPQQDNSRTTGRGRVTSLGPSRTAHFSDVPVLDTLTVRHNPLPRSVSPAKSALKHSPASSIRTSSPMAMFSPASGKAPPSDTSDTTSLASQDGTKAGKKKKSVRVSFGDESTVVLPPASEPKPITGATTISDVDDIDEIMKPRPALPSFGSVRSKKLPVRAEPAEEVTETVSSSMSASVSTLPDSVETSNDDVIGAVIANHHAAKGRITEPQRESTEYAQAVPLQSASVEGSGDTSDTSDYAEVEPEGVRQRIRPATAAAYGESSMPDGDVPAINLLPPTPGTDEEGKRLSMGTATARPQLQKRRSMPGEWDEPAPEEQHSDVESLPEEPQSLQPSAPVTSFERRSPQLAPIDESDSDDSAAFSDAAEDLSDLDDGGFASLDAIVESPVAPHAPDVAISTPPDSPSVRLPAPSTAPVKSSPLAQESGDWREATAYWSSLSKKKREQIEQEALPTEAEPPSPVAPVKKTKKKQPEAVNTLPAAAATPKALETAQQARAPAMRKSMRAASGPTPATNEPNMRTSMRDTRSGGMKTSMRGTNNAPAPPQEQKRTIKSASSDNLRGAALSSASAAAAANRQPVKRTTAPRPASALATVPVPVANDSDSESSFRKRRRPSVSTVDSAGRYTMKRSMRAGSIDSETRPISPTPTGRGAGRMSLRSLSPTGSFLGRNRESLMNSLRGGPVDNTPTMRGKNSKARQSKTSSGFSMSGFSKDSKPAKAAPPKMGSRFKSRFDDSDDEGDAAPSRFAFRSRFADSDDEDDSPVGPPRHIPADLTPVRGIPRRRGQDDEDSTDLDDSDEEAARPTKTGARDSQRTKSKPGVPSQSDVDKAMEAARRNVAAMNGGREPGVPEAKAENKATNQVTLQPQAEVLQPGSSPSKAQELGLDTPKRRRGVLGSILGRKRTSSSVVPTMASYASPGTEPAGPQSPVTLRSPRLQRKNTPQFSRQNTGLSTTIPPPPQTAAQMQESAPQVNTPGGISQNSQNWPLPPPPNVTADGVGAARPATSDGVSAEAIKLARTMRPDIGRRSQSGGNILDGADGDSPRAKGGKNVVYSERTGRKKKFAGLRRLFGLTD